MHTFKKYLYEIIMITPAFLYLLGFFIFIVIYLLKVSLTYESSGSESVFPVITNYLNVFGDEKFTETYLRTFIFVVLGTPLELFTGIFCAVILKNKVMGMKAVRSIAIIPFAVPTIVSAIVILVIFDHPIGHINSILSGNHAFFPFSVIAEPINWRSNSFFAMTLAMLGKVWRDTPISTFIILNGLMNISKEEIDTAKTLGAGRRAIFRYITLPQLLPSIFLVLFLRSIEFWKEFIFPYILSGRYSLLATLIEEYYRNWNMVREASVICVLLLLSIIITVIIIRICLKIFEKKITNLIN